MEAEPRFRRIRGYRNLQYVVGTLHALAPPDDVVAEVALHWRRKQGVCHSQSSTAKGTTPEKYRIVIDECTKAMVER